ncbi:four-carbon acid sugar kinase family protein [Aquimarina aggregata]|uniref:four-carbon acid sugar kinase family protein n=1 Tax=Aquimarina aggregata TaxID=1642818 RepID=UPI002490F452|nr:four-carbon acid sugar kinase family protein [Aquimarina aggregata]
MSVDKTLTIPNKLSLIREELQKKQLSIVILDDDPTGTQTMNNVPVVTTWAENILEKELLKSPVFFILTNSRSLTTEKANELSLQIGESLQRLATKHNKKLLVISRGDSTLRGHYPNEVDALAKGLGIPAAKHLLIPAFFEGGRYTYNDIHYVKERNSFIPVAETPFAKDNTFGYVSSDLKDWIVEKSNGNIKVENIASVSIELIKDKGVEGVASIIRSAASYIIVNATKAQHLQTVALACLQYDVPLLYRTAASFVNAISGTAVKNCLTKDELFKNRKKGPALVVIGSYVPKTTRQLVYLQENFEACFLEFEVSKIDNPDLFSEEIHKIKKEVNTAIQKGKDVVLYTSRKVISGETKTASLEIINRISEALIKIVRDIQSRPGYIIAKGGITSSDIAVKALSAEKANVMGQVIKGVPVWQLGDNSKYPKLPYIVFPGNVGNDAAIYDVLKLLQ